jgi:transcriptional regulator with XRE-family HTH domain
MMEKLELEYLREIGRDLKKARCKAKLTQADVARSVHTKKSVISRVETGAQNVSVGYLVKIANALGKSVNIQLCDHH